MSTILGNSKKLVSHLRRIADEGSFQLVCTSRKRKVVATYNGQKKTLTLPTPHADDQTKKAMQGWIQEIHDCFDPSTPIPELKW